MAICGLILHKKINDVLYTILFCLRIILVCTCGYCIKTYWSFGKSNHNAEVGHPHCSESVQANVRDDLDNVALELVDSEKVEGQDCVNRSREHLELILQHHLLGLVNDTHLARQIANLIGDQFAQGRLSRNTAPSLHDAARDRPLEADIKAWHCDN